MSQRVTLDDIDMRARLRSQSRDVQAFGYTPRPLPQTSHRLFQDFDTQRQPIVPKPEPQFVTAFEAPAAPAPQPITSPAPIPLQRPFASPDSAVTLRKTFPLTPRLPKHAYDPNEQEKIRVPLRSRLRFLKLSRSNLLTAMAVLVFLVGVGVSFMGFKTNNAARAQISQINRKTTAATTTNDDSTPPVTTPVTMNDVESYHVAGDLPQTIRIPRLNVYARVLQVGVTKTGALATPTNVFDTAWYKGSAKPGQQGASLIDGHVSSWTSNGVFYGIKNLEAGDEIQIQKGDNSLLTYNVVKTVVYDANNVDMHALIQPVDANASGLNLITCGGKYDSKAGEFTQRIAVFASLKS